MRTFITLLSAVLYCGYSYAQDDVTLSVKPNRCVSLHRGQLCYQSLQFEWRSLNRSFCLYIEGQAQAVTCQAAATQVRYRYEFESDKSRRFELRDDQGNVVAETLIEVASVYKGQRRATTGWRIF